MYILYIVYRYIYIYKYLYILYKIYKVILLNLSKDFIYIYMYIGIDNTVYSSNFFLKDRFKRFTIFEKKYQG